MDGNLGTTNIILGIMAAVSVLEALVIIGVGVAGYLVYRRVMELVNGIEQRQVAPAMARVNAILDDVKGLDGLSFELPTFDLGGERFLRTGEVLPDGALEDLRRCDAIYLGAVGHPGVAPGVLEKGILLRLRFAFQKKERERKDIIHGEGMRYVIK